MPIEHEYNTLRELGFTEREIKVYLALIELGTSTVGPLSKKTRLQPSKVYETIEKLKEKGLASFIVVSKTKHFKASNPKEILNILDEKKRMFKEIVDSLVEKQRFAGSNQIAIIHEGYKSFSALFNSIVDTLGPKDYYYAFAFKDEYYNPSTALFLKKFHERLAEKKVDDRLIGHISVKRVIKKTFHGNDNFKIRFTNNLWPSVIVMYKGRAVHLLWGERPTAIEIISDQVHEQYKNFFLEIWQHSKE